MDFDHQPDDHVVPVVSYEEDVKKVAVEDVSLNDIMEDGISAQRLAVSRLLRKYAPGAMRSAVPEYGRKMGNQKMFRMTKLLQWLEGPPDVVVNALREGRLRCRLSAAMGLGKSTLLASYVAKMMNYRVLHISLDAHALQQVGVYIHSAGIGKISRNFSEKKTARVCTMTYDDFCGWMAASRRAELFKSFDVLIFDEGFVKNEAAVEVAGWFFSEYALPDTNLILCSGTLRTDVEQSETGSGGLGTFRQISVTKTVEEVISGGKLIADYLVDRTMVLVPTNSNVYDLAEHYDSNGVDVKYLDDASDYEALRSVVEWLDGDSTTPRVVVAHWRYYIAFNFPISYAVIWPFYEVTECVDGVCRSRIEPMSESMVAQAKSRTGRGIVEGSGGIIMSPERSVDVELIKSERMRAFVLLCAGAIKPLRTPYWADCYKLFPDALTVGAAMNILKMCLPVEIAAKYLGSDGNVAHKFCRAINAFAQPDHYLQSSVDDYPVGYDSWKNYESLLDAGTGYSEDLKLPYDCEGELRVVLVAIEMLAQDRIKVPRWRNKRSIAYNDGYDSDEEQRDSRFVKPSIYLRRIEDKPLPVIPNIEPIRALPWEYRQVNPGIPDNRVGGYINSERCKQALLDLERCLLDYMVPVAPIQEVIEDDSGSVTPIVVEGFGEVESPGGSVVCKLPVRICEKMNVGQELSPKEFVTMATAARVDTTRFVASKTFDCFAGPWQSILESLLINAVSAEVVKKGIASDVYGMVDKMRYRFNVELCSVLANSNLFKKTFLRVFRKSPTADDVMKEVRAGKFNLVAQTDGFLDRVKKIKTLIDEVLLHAERNCVYLPTYITSAQRSMPIRGNNRLGYVGDDINVMPKGVGRYIEGIVHDKGGTSSFGRKRASQ